MFEIKHLKTLSSLQSTGNIRKAAETLFISQSALSHQLKDLEQRLNAPLFIRNTSPVQFTAQGEILLALANDILPKITHTLFELEEANNTVTKLNVAIACHACFQWLLPATEKFSQQFPKLKIDFLEQVFPLPSDHQTATKIDILFTDETNADDGFTYQALGTFEVVAVLAKPSGDKASAANKNNLSHKTFLSAADFSQQVLLTYPIQVEQLDIFKLFLNKIPDSNKKHHKPKAIKQVANSQ